MSLKDLYERFKLLNRKLTARSTDNSYRVALRQFRAAVGHEPTLADLTDDNLVALEKLLVGRSPYTVNERTSRIKALWRFAAKLHLVQQWPTAQRLPCPEPYRRAWDLPELHKLFLATAKMKGDYAGVPAGQWWRTWLRIQWETGERPGALLLLRWDWVCGTRLDLPAEARKGKFKAASYNLSARGLAQLESIRQPVRKLVFPWDRCPAAFFLHWDRLLKLAGLPSGRKNKSQRMRRTHLTWWAAGGGDATQRAQHSSSGITQRYYLDESLLNCPDPDDFLPPLSEADGNEKAPAGES